MKKAFLAAGVAALVLTACGGDSDQDKVASILLAEAERDGLNADEDCVKGVASQLSDDDAQKLLDLGEDEDIEEANLSDAGFSTAIGVLNCVDVSSFIDEAIADLRSQGIAFDEQCVRDAFEGLDFSQFTADGDIPPGLQDGLLSCIDLGG